MGRKKLYTDEYLLDIIRKEAKKLGKTPSAKHFSQSTILPSIACYLSRWGSWNNAVTAAGLKANSKNERKLDEFSLLKEKPRPYVNLGTMKNEERKHVRKIFIRGYKAIYYIKGDEVRAAKEFLIVNREKIKIKKLRDVNKNTLSRNMVDLIRRLYQTLPE